MSATKKMFTPGTIPGGGEVMFPDGSTATVALDGSVQVPNAYVASDAAIAKSKLGALAIADGDVAAGAAIAASKLAAGGGVAALLGAGLGGSATYVKTDTGTKTLVAAHATKDRAVIVEVHIEQTFADGDTSQLILKVGETDTVEKFFASAVFTGATAGSIFIIGAVNTATKAIIATLTAAAGTGTGSATVTIIAMPTT